MRNRDDIPSPYYDGRECRKHGGNKMANPFSATSIKGSWWLAGHNDMDIELSHENQTNGAETQPATKPGPLAA